MSLTPDDILRLHELKYADREAKIAFVRQLIVELRWDANAARETGETWGISPSDVGKLGTLAHSLILAAMGDPRDLRASILVKLNFVAEDALRKKKPFLDKTGAVVLAPDPDHKAAVQALAHMGRLAGLEDPASHDDYSKKSLEELMTLARRKLLPGAQPKGITNDKQGSDNDSSEILTTGVSAGGADSNHSIRAALKERPVSDTDSRRSSSKERVRGRGTRGDRDPTGFGRGRGPEGE